MAENKKITQAVLEKTEEDQSVTLSGPYPIGSDTEYIIHFGQVLKDVIGDPSKISNFGSIVDQIKYLQENAIAPGGSSASGGLKIVISSKNNTDITEEKLKQEKIPILWFQEVE